MYANALLSLSLLSLLPSLSAAAPTVGTVSAISMAAAENWTITSLSRTCEEDLSKCTWSFGILRSTDASSPAPSPTPDPTSSSSSAPPASTSTPAADSHKKERRMLRRAEEEETPCEHVLEALEDGTPATQIRGSGPSTCGAFTVTSGWSDAGGPGREFTTISVVDYAHGLIVYPSYLDSLVAEGEVVEPDLSFPVQGIPAF